MSGSHAARHAEVLSHKQGRGTVTSHHVTPWLILLRTLKIVALLTPALTAVVGYYIASCLLSDFHTHVRIICSILMKLRNCTWKLLSSSLSKDLKICHNFINMKS